MNVRTLTHSLADACGYPRDLLVWNDLFAARILAPELVLYPQCFDLPGGDRPGRTYASPSIDFQREEPSFPWRQLSDDLPLALCAMGTVAYLPREQMRAFLQAVIYAAAWIRPAHQFVIATGNLNPVDFHSPAPNVMLVKDAPQLALLARASLMITHGGPNSVKECAWFGVPVVVFPLGFDQPATAARVRFHGLGVVGSVRKATPENIQTLVEAVTRIRYYRAQAAWMRDRLRAVDGAGVELREIESVLHAQSARHFRQGGA